MDKNDIYLKMINKKKELDDLKKKKDKYNKCLIALNSIYSSVDSVDNKLSEGRNHFKKGGYIDNGKELHSDLFGDIDTKLDDIEIEINTLKTKTSGKISLMVVEEGKLTSEYNSLKNKYESL